MYEAKHNLNPRDFANTFKEINDKYPTRYSKNNFEKPKATRHGSRTAATSKMERFVIIANGWKPLTIITKRSILDVAAVLDPLLAITKTTISAIFSQGLHFWNNYLEVNEKSQLLCLCF